jgi:hypothetical protein
MCEERGGDEGRKRKRKKRKKEKNKIKERREGLLIVS